MFLNKHTEIRINDSGDLFVKHYQRSYVMRVFSFLLMLLGIKEDTTFHIYARDGKLYINGMEESEYEKRKEHNNKLTKRILVLFGMMIINTIAIIIVVVHLLKNILR